MKEFFHVKVQFFLVGSKCFWCVSEEPKAKGVRIEAEPPAFA